MLPTLRQFAASCLLMLALLHVGAEPVSALLGLPVQLQAGCEALGVPAGAIDSATNEAGDSGRDGCCNSCCFCCCSHVLPEPGLDSPAIGDSLAEPVMTFLYSPDQDIQPGLLPPRG